MTDDDLQYAIDHANRFNVSEILDEILSAFVRYRIVFFIVFMMELIFNSFLLYITWQKKEYTMKAMENNYRGFHKKESLYLFYSIYGIMVISNVLLYPLGIVALATKKIKILKFFTKYALYSSLAIIFMVFINL